MNLTVVMICPVSDSNRAKNIDTADWSSLWFNKTYQHLKKTQRHRDLSRCRLEEFEKRKNTGLFASDSLNESM